MRKPMRKVYLGDGVYLEPENEMLKLTTNNGMSDTNAIFLEPEVLAAFMDYVLAFNAEQQAESDAAEYFIMS